jgi:hypothetical protein
VARLEYVFEVDGGVCVAYSHVDGDGDSHVDAESHGVPCFRELLSEAR